LIAGGDVWSAEAPIAAGAWAHVAGLFDGASLTLLVDGTVRASVAVPIHPGDGGRQPEADERNRGGDENGDDRQGRDELLIGASWGLNAFDGTIDEVFVSTEPTTPEVLSALACIARPSTLGIDPATSGPVGLETGVHYGVTATDNDVGFCAPKTYVMLLSSVIPNLKTVFDFPPGISQAASPGASARFGVTVTSSEDAELGDHPLPFLVDAFAQPTSQLVESLSGQLDYDLVASCFVFERRELMITDTSVVDDPVRTVASATNGATNGAWSFGGLMREVAPTPDQAPAMVLDLFQTWLTDQSVNGFVVAARPAMQPLVLDFWPKTASGDLDLDQSPLTLEAIVNRIDIRDLSAGSAGEVRFVFGLDGPAFPNFTVIVEYGMPAQSESDVLEWANLWHGLSALGFPSEEYNAALEAITRRVTARGASPSRLNGSSLVELRTNEVALSPNTVWELRGFQLSTATGFFEETTAKDTPDLSFNGTPELADFVNANAAAIKAVVPGAMSNTVPALLAGAPFMAGSIPNNLAGWNAPGILDPDARFHMSLNTCNGCHGSETNTQFLMIAPRTPGTEAVLSAFLTGTVVTDAFSGQTRALNDLARRKADLTGVVCADGGTTD
jgi:hypothetical protein